MKILKAQRHNVTYIVFRHWLMSYGVKILPNKTRQFYELSMFNRRVRFKNKPKYRNLAVLSVVLFVPYVIYQIGYALFLLLCFLFYATIGYIRQAIDDWGWGDRYFLAVGLFWQAVSILLIIKLFFVK